MSKRLVLILIFSLATLSLLAFSLVYTRKGEQAPVPTTELDGYGELQQLIAQWVHPDSSRFVSGWLRLYNGADGTLQEELPFSMKQDQGKFFGQVGPLQYLFDGHLLVQVDTLNRLLQAEPVPKGTRKGGGALFPLEGWGVDSSRTGLHIVAVQQGELCTLTLLSDQQPDLKACRIFYKPGSYRIVRSEMEWWQPQALNAAASREAFWLTRIEYRYLPPEKLDMEALLRRYVHIRGNRVRLQPLYEDYQVNGALFTN